MFTQGGQLRFVDPRTFGEMFVTPYDGMEQDVEELAHLGLDPLETAMSWDYFGELFAQRHMKLKTALMDQKFMAGIGNIYSDEILFTAGLRWDRMSDSLSPEEVRRLYRSVVETLQDAVKYRGSSLADEQYVDLFGNKGEYQLHHKVYAREGDAVPAVPPPDRAREGRRSQHVLLRRVPGLKLSAKRRGVPCARLASQSRRSTLTAPQLPRCLASARFAKCRRAPETRNGERSVWRVFLKSLTLRGFKSFADKTVLEFEPGVMVVVGPNGSGKSNLVDAVAWVLGAQGPRTLRGGKMDDVIFAGTPDRPALGRAEVSLTIDNTRQPPADRVLRGHDHPDPVPHRGLRVRHQRRPVPAPRHPGAALRHRHRPPAARHRGPGPARRGPDLPARGPPGA